MKNRKVPEEADKVLYEYLEKTLQEEGNKYFKLTLKISMFPGSGRDSVSCRQAMSVIEDVYDTINQLKKEGKITPEVYNKILEQITG